MTEVSVWAPFARDSVDLVLGDERVPMSRDAGGWWRGELPEAPGTAYAFALDGGDPRPDPRSRRQPDGPHGRSVAFDPNGFGWTDQDWAGVQLPSAVIYELHIGTFTAEGTFDAAIKRLDHLVELGIDLVEVMPVASFPGRHGWGYDGVDLYAVHEPYGGPVALQRFVDACHARGLGVCLDVVYNHLGPDGNYLGEFGPYFTDRYVTPWGQALNLDGPGSDEVRRFVLDNVTQWLRDFHIDALRLDAVHALVDDRALPLLEEMEREVEALAAEVNRPLWLIAESDRNDPRTVTRRTPDPDAGGGLGLHAQWADDVHHALHVLLTGETFGYYADFADPGALAKVLTTPFFHDGTWSSFRERTHGRPVDTLRLEGWHFVASLQTHDQVGNRAVGDRLSRLIAPGLLAAGAALLLTSAYSPMLFMGEEWGASTPWQYFTDHVDPELARLVSEGRRREFASHGWDSAEVPDPQDPATVERSRLDWSEPGQPPHDRLLRWYRALLTLRRQRADLRDPHLDRVGVDHDHAARTVVVTRGEHRVAVNLGSGPALLDLGEATAYRQVVLAWDEGARLTDDGRLSLPGESAAVVGPA
ncbi:malto-oligosyltrehalose trehalohydrolase [Oryzihumus sp.]